MLRHIRDIGVLGALALAALAIAACGGGGGGSSTSGGSGGGGSAVSSTSLIACAKKAGLPAKAESFDKSIGETGQVGVSIPGDTLTVTLFGDESGASAYLDALGGEGPNQGAEPGGNEQVGTAVVAYYKQGATLSKIEGCLG